MKKVFISLTAIFLCTTFARADLQELSGQAFTLYTPNNLLSEQSFRLDDTGVGEYIQNGATQGIFNAPDCLAILNTYEIPTEKALAFARTLLVENGFGILSSSSDSSERKELKPKVVNGTVIFYISDLSKYVTGLSIKTRDGNSFLSHIQETLGDNATGLVIQHIPGCTNVAKP